MALTFCLQIFKELNFLFPDKVKALDNIWVIGDISLNDTVQYGQELGGISIASSYICKKSDVTFFMPSNSSLDRIYVSRLHNCLARAMKDDFKFPKYLLLILDPLCLEYVHKEGERILKWMIN